MTGLGALTTGLGVLITCLGVPRITVKQYEKNDISLETLLVCL